MLSHCHPLLVWQGMQAPRRNHRAPNQELRLARAAIPESSFREGALLPLQPSVVASSGRPNRAGVSLLSRLSRQAPRWGTLFLPNPFTADAHTEAPLPRLLDMEPKGAGEPCASILAVSGSKQPPSCPPSAGWLEAGDGPRFLCFFFFFIVVVSPHPKIYMYIYILNIFY